MTGSNLVSIVLPTYNGSKYLAQAIDSVLQQTYKRWELIIVDDHSTDESLAIAYQYSSRDERIFVLEHDYNRRLPEALNTGFEACQGDYLTWTSDDNLYHSNAIETLVDFLDNHPNIGLVYTDFARINSHGEFIETHVVNDYRTTLHIRNCIGPSFMYRREVKSKIGRYDPRLELVEDYDYWCRIALQFEIAALHRNIYSYRVHDDSLTSKRQRDIGHKVAKVAAQYALSSPTLSREQKATALWSLFVSAHAQNDRLQQALIGMKLVSISPAYITRKLVYRVQNQLRFRAKQLG